MEQKGIMRVPAAGGGAFLNINMFNSCFIGDSGDWAPV